MRAHSNARGNTEYTKTEHEHTYMFRKLILLTTIHLLLPAVCLQWYEVTCKELTPVRTCL